MNSLPPFDRYPLQTVLVHGHRTAYLRHGTGPPLVLLHGYAGAIWNWEHQIEELGKRFTLYIPDLLGHGLSDKPRVPYTPRLYVDWIVGYLDALGVERADFAGNSMGCGVGMALAITAPRRVGRLVLISGFPARVLDSIHGPYLRFFSRLGAGSVFAAAYHLMGQRTFRKLLRGIVHDPALITPAIIDRAYRLRKEHGSAWPLWSLLRHIDQWEREFAPYLGRLTAPALIIWGEQDRFLPPEVGGVLHRSIPHARFAVVPKTGHLPMWEQPEAVNQLMLKFLSSQPILDLGRGQGL